MKILFKLPGCKQMYCLTDDCQFGPMVLFMFGSLMGIFYKIEWYSLLFMNLLMARLEVLNSIIQALKNSLKQLGILSFFGVSLITLFSIFSLNSYIDQIYPDKYPDTHCETAMGCVIQLYINEQIGEDMDQFQAGRFTYNMIYAVVMGSLFNEILGSVLTDNLGSLRESREEML